MLLMLLLAGLGLGALIANRNGLAAYTGDYNPQPGEWITVEQVYQARDLVQLTTYYEHIKELLAIGVIDMDIYDDLYDAYVSRWHELAKEKV